MNGFAAGVIVAAILGTPQTAPPADHPSTIARTFLTALKASNFDEIQKLAVPSVVDSYRQTFNVLLDYKIIREQLCSESIEFATVKASLVSLVDADAPSPEAWMAAVNRLETLHPCLARVVLSQGLSKEVVSKLDGKVSFADYEVVVDVQRPGLANTRQTDRGVLRLFNVRSAGMSTGWKVGTFEPF